ncbi:hypothetical protein KEM54_001256 [Ascosphaera aggregata]|nr:hypothetical protein KEM54_001256 [Ascosphaera aggregata]
MSALKSSNLYSLKKLRSLPESVTLFTAYFNSKNVYQSIALRYLQTPFHPLKPKIQHAYATRERGILWWNVLHGEINSEKKRTRSVFLRKTRQAFIDALKARNFDAQGRRLANGSDTVLDENRYSWLKGTLEIRLRKGILQASQETIEVQAGLIVDAIKRPPTRKPDRKNGRA